MQKARSQPGLKPLKPPRSLARFSAVAIQHHACMIQDAIDKIAIGGKAGVVPVFDVIAD